MTACPTPEPEAPPAPPPTRDEQVAGLAAVVQFLAARPLVPVPDLDNIIATEPALVLEWLDGLDTLDAEDLRTWTGAPTYVWHRRRFGPLTLEAMLPAALLGVTTVPGAIADGPSSPVEHVDDVAAIRERLTYLVEHPEAPTSEERYAF